MGLSFSLLFDVFCDADDVMCLISDDADVNDCIADDEDDVAVMVNVGKKFAAETRAGLIPRKMFPASSENFKK